MRLVLRRLLWLGPILLAITLLSFGILSTALPSEVDVADLRRQLPKGMRELF